MEIKHITFYDRDGVCSIGYRGDGVYEYACRVATSVIFVFFMKIFGQFFAKICTIFCFREKNKYIFFDNFHEFFFVFSNVAFGGWVDLGNMWKKIGRYSHIQIQYWNSWKSCQTSCTLFTKGQRVGQCSVITVLVFMNILSNLMHPTIGLWDGSMFSVHRTGIHEHLVKPHAPYICTKGQWDGSMFSVHRNRNLFWDSGKSAGKHGKSTEKVRS